MYKKKILVILWHPDGVYTGGSFAIAKKSLQLYKDDKDISLYIIDKAGSQLEQDAYFRLLTYDVPKIVLKIKHFSFLLYRLCELLILPFIIYRKSREIIIQHNVDIVYIPIAELVILDIPAYIIKRRFHLRVVGLIHSIGGNTYKPREKISEMMNTFHSRGMSMVHAVAQACLYRFLNYFNRKIINNFDVLMTVSDEMKNRLLLWLGERKYPVLRFGFDYSEYDKILETNKQHDAVFLGRLNEQKGLTDLVEIWSQVVKLRPGASLLIIGDGEDSFVSNIKRRFQSANIETNITFAGIKFGEDKIRLLKSSRIFLFPSHFESHSLVIDEAIACNLPIVAWDLSVYKSRVQHSSHFARIKFGEISIMAKEVIRVLENKQTVNTDRPLLPTWEEYHTLEKQTLLYGKSF